MPLPTSLSPAVVATTIVRLRGGETLTDQADFIAAEAPLEIRVGKRATVLMRTPGDDDDLVHGFLFNEGMIERLSDIVSIRRPAPTNEGEDGNVIIVDLGVGGARALLDRSLYSSSACGACGKTSIAQLAVRGEPSTSRLRIRRAVLETLPARLRQAQPAFQDTGGLHASALFTARGQLVCVREDVGRHNALDKLVGWALKADALPLDRHVLLVSGRVSYELMQKAIAASIPFIAAVGAPSSFAVELAQHFQLTLVGFLRPGSLNVYTGSHRVTSQP